jgi:hypothetical protein
MAAPSHARKHKNTYARQNDGWPIDYNDVRQWFLDESMGTQTSLTDYQEPDR